ncbi:MAG TPA: Flp pilus assembly protein CpaB [Verrucomicrobiae bacterium]|jgi:pilus assembly protein CpaB|nr:Flp pilus assembly protein CpaB [Verrucomicrobiae bacterium]
MNRTRLLMIGVLALALGLLASIYVYKNLQARNGGSEPGFDVIVAADDLQVGTRVEDHDIKIIKIAGADVPPGAPRRKSDVVGHGVIIPIAKGEFILPNKLAGENAGAGLPALIPPGMRAVSVRVNEVVSVAGFVTPGTRVDVLLTGTPNGSTDPQTTTVLQNVAVLASGHTLERTATGEAQNTPVITLLVSPDDAERLALASAQGHIQLALRNPLDTRAEDVAAANERQLYKGVAAPAPEHAPVHRVVAKAVAPLPPPAPSGVSVEVYQGDKKPDVVKCTDEGCENK